MLHSFIIKPLQFLKMRSSFFHTIIKYDWEIKQHRYKQIARTWIGFQLDYVKLFPYQYTLVLDPIQELHLQIL